MPWPVTLRDYLGLAKCRSYINGPNEWIHRQSFPHSRCCMHPSHNVKLRNRSCLVPLSKLLYAHSLYLNCTLALLEHWCKIGFIFWTHFSSPKHILHAYLPIPLEHNKPRPTPITYLTSNGEYQQNNSTHTIGPCNININAQPTQVRPICHHIYGHNTTFFHQNAPIHYLSQHKFLSSSTLQILYTHPMQ